MTRGTQGLSDQLAALHGQVHDRDRDARHAAMRADVMARAFVPRRRAAARWSISITALVVATAALVLVVGKLWPQPLGFTVEAGASDVNTQAFFVTDDAPQTMTFTDGSTLELGPHSRLRVVTRRADGADVVLETGTMVLQVAGGGSWRVDAGPYVVVTHDAELELRWSPDSASFDLSTRRGDVTLGDRATEGTRTIAAGEHVRLCDVVAEVVVPDEPSPTPVAPAVVRPTREPRSRPGKPAPTLGPDWRTLAKAGRYDDALALARDLGFAKLCSTLDADALLQLADVGRYGGDTARANEALLALRKRFPGSDQAATAAFDLGRLSSSAQARCTKAVTWFETYVDERPRGAMADAARKRIAECRSP